MVERNIVAIIPARGGSKRIPKKNIIDFLGKPIIAWTIESAKASGLFSKIIVSTDDAEIAEVSTKYGAEVPFLRNEKSDDWSPVSEATIITLRQLEKAGEKFDDVVQLFAVCPLRHTQDINDAYNFYVKSKRNFVLSCFKYIWMNPMWAISLNEHNEGTWINQDALKRSQDLPQLVCPTGAVWIASVQELLIEKTFYGKGHVYWEMNWRRAIDIDNYQDLELAKALAIYNSGQK